MPITLCDLDDINTSISKEHAAWVNKNAPTSIDRTKIIPNQYSILDYPELWSGARLFETSIEKQGWGRLPASEEIERLINQAKKKHKKGTEKIKELEEFKKNYKKYLEFIKERCLLLAISETLKNIPFSEDKKQTKIELEKLLGQSSLFKLQTHLDCLEAHKEISLLCSELRNTNKNEIEQIRQLEVLAKRLIDCHYEGAKKTTFDEAITQNIATISSLIGLLTGVPAAGLGIAGIFFPPLLIPATILGAISLISYVSSVILAAKVLNEAIDYGRSPSPSDLAWLVIDTVMLPFNFFGGKILSSIGHVVRPLKHAKELVKHLKTIWDTVITNLFPDAAETKEVFSDLGDIGSMISGSGQLKNTTTATSWQKISSALAEHDRETLTTINEMKNEITKLNKKTAIHGRDFAFIKKQNTGLMHGRDTSRIATGIIFLSK